MKTLVLNVDRDDDFGRKARVESPIIGLSSNVDAANKLGQVDPEDSDLNAIFSAIATYNEFKNEGKNVEIATICGNIAVGIKSDEILSQQLEKVLETTKATEVILLSDGAEDEYILPIVQSRIKIVSVKRVSVKQSEELEDTYYRIVKLLGDEKVAKQLFLPIALVLIVWAIFVWLDMTRAGFGAILLILGVYLLIRIYRLEEKIEKIWEEIKSGFLTGKLSTYTYVIAIVILIAFGFVAWDGLQKESYNPDADIIPISYSISKMIWGVVIAGLLIIFGRAVDEYVREKKAPWKYYTLPFSLFAFGFITFAISDAVYDAFDGWPAFDTQPFREVYFIGYVVAGILTAIVGAVVYHYIKDIYTTQEKELEIEKQTTVVENH